MKVFALIFLVASCATQPASVRGDAAALIIPSCSPDDGLDDRACLQAALDAACLVGGGTVHLTTGTWELSRPAQVPGNRDNASLWMECPNLALEGEGPATVLAMTGDGLASDWSAIRIAGQPNGAMTDRVSVSNMTITSDAAFNINEQTHLLFLGSNASTPGPISNVQIHHLRLRHPVRPEVAGDCLRFVGEAATPITFVDVGSVVFESCDRSGIAVQRAVQDVNLHDLMMIDIGKTAVDMEPTGPGPIARFEMRHLHIFKGGLSIAGQSTEYTTDVIVSSSHINGRLGLTYARRVVIAADVIEETATSADGSLQIRASDQVEVSASSVRRLSGSTAGPALKVLGASGTFSARVLVTGSAIENASADNVVAMESAQDVTLTGNEISGASSVSSGVWVRATGRDVARLTIAGNRFRGPLLYSVLLAGNPYFVLGATVTGNSSDAWVTGAGLRCENPLKITRPIVHSGYYYDAGTATSGCTGVSVVTQFP